MRNQNKKDSMGSNKIMKLEMDKTEQCKEVLMNKKTLLRLK